MPYYFLFDQLPAERPAGPLHGDYLPAKAVAVPLSDDGAASDGRGGRGGFLRRFLGSKSPPPSEPALAEIARVLREAAFVAITCRYDGGNDEGFAHFESASTADNVFLPDEVIARLRGTRLGAVDYFPYAHVGKRTPEEERDWIARRSEVSEEERIRDWLFDWFVQDVAVALLGEGFGTGEYAMAGRFRFDLCTGRITDLPIDPPPDFSESAAFSLDDYYPEEGET